MSAMAGLDFSTIIAFLLPGFVAVYSLSYLSPRIADLFKALLTKDSSTGASLLLIFAALATGVLVGGVRSLVLDRLQFATGVKKKSLNYSRLCDPAVLKAFNAAISATYRFAQFYGNMAVALGLFIALKWLRAPSATGRQIPLLVLALLAFTALLVRHRQSLSETYDRLSEILSTKPAEEASHGGKEEDRKEEGQTGETHEKEEGDEAKEEEDGEEGDNS